MCGNVLGDRIVPDCVVRGVLRFLDAPVLVRVSEVNREAYRWARDPFLWKPLVLSVVGNRERVRSVLSSLIMRDAWFEAYRWVLCGKMCTWGSGQGGRLGLGGERDSKFPSVVPGLPGIRAVSCGHGFWAAVGVNGTVWTCGRNPKRQLGFADVKERLVPEKVLLPGCHIVDVSSGAFHTLFLGDSGYILSCGDNRLGQLGNNAAATKAPSPVMSFDAEFVSEGATIIRCGGSFSCAISPSHGLFVFGWIPGAAVRNDVATRVPFEEAIVDVSCRQDSLMFLTQSGRAYVWGSGADHQLGLGDCKDRALITELSSLPGKIILLGGGRCHSLAVSSDGSVYAWGSHISRQCGLTTESASIEIPTLLDPFMKKRKRAGDDPRPVMLSDSCSADHSLVLMNNGSVYSFGNNYHRQLGAHARDFCIAKPVRVSIPPHVSVMSVSCGARFSAAIVFE